MLEINIIIYFNNDFFVFKLIDNKKIVLDIYLIIFHFK